MQAPWLVSLGTTLAVAAISFFLFKDRFYYLKPFSSIILHDYGIIIAAHSALLLLTFAAAAYAAARAIGLADFGKKLKLLERSTRRGEGDQELSEALRRDDQGDWQ